MKIFYCITKSNWGGAQKYVYDLATALDDKLFDVTVILGTTGILGDKLNSLGIKTLILGKLSRDVSVYRDFICFLKLTQLFRREKPDIIHLNSSKMGILGAVAGKLAGVPKIIFTGHGWAFNEDRSAFQKKIIKFLHSLTISLADKTIAVSEETKRQILSAGPEDGKITVIRNGLNPIELADKEIARSKIAEKLPVDIDLENRFWVGTVSELHKNKGLEYLIDAARSFDPKVITVIIGEGEERNSLQEKINLYDLKKRVFLVGRIDEASKYLKAFDIFTLTSITEALPYVILEAGAAGLPVVASGVGGISEIIDDMKSGILIRPKSREEILKAITHFLNNPDKMGLFGQNLKSKIDQDFSRERMLRETLALYQ